MAAPHPLTALLLAVRHSGERMTGLPELAVPATLDDAYQVHDELLAELGPVAAWKVTPLVDGEIPRGAPILARDVVHSGATLQRSTLPAVEIEVEVAVSIGQPLPARGRPYDAADIAAVITAQHIALELVVSRFHDRKTVSPLAGVADLMSNGAVVVGPAVPYSDQLELTNLAMTLNYDGQLVDSTQAGQSRERMLNAIAWLANHAANRGLPLQPGTVVITGARIGPKLLGDHTLVEASAPGLGAVSVTLA